METVKRRRIEVSICIVSLIKDMNSCDDSGKCKRETSLLLQEITWEKHAVKREVSIVVGYKNILKSLGWKAMETLFLPKQPFADVNQNR